MATDREMRFVVKLERNYYCVRVLTIHPNGLRTYSQVKRRFTSESAAEDFANELNELGVFDD